MTTFTACFPLWLVFLISCLRNLCLSQDAEDNSYVLFWKLQFYLSHLEFKSPLDLKFYVWCEVRVRASLTSYLTHPAALNEDCPSLTALWCYAVINQVSIYVWVCFWIFNSVPFIYVPILVPILYCFNYCSFMINLISSSVIPLISFFLFKNALAIFNPLLYLT